MHVKFVVREGIYIPMIENKILQKQQQQTDE